MRAMESGKGSCAKAKMGTSMDASRSAQATTDSETDNELEELGKQAAQVEEIITDIHSTKQKLAELRKKAQRVTWDKELNVQTQKFLEQETETLHKIQELDRRKTELMIKCLGCEPLIKSRKEELSELEAQFVTNPDLFLEMASLADIPREPPKTEEVSTDDWTNLSCVDSVSSDRVRKDTVKSLNEVGNSVALFGSPSAALQPNEEKFLCFASVTGQDEVETQKLAGQGENLAKAVDDVCDRLEQFIMTKEKGAGAGDRKASSDK